MSTPNRTYYPGLLYQPDCHICPLKNDRKVLPDGPIPAKMCYVGEGPGFNERDEGRGFVGPSGQLLWTLAGAYGIKRENVWVTNSALCMPRDVKLSTGAVLKKLKVIELSSKACRKRLIYELLYVTGNNPNAVIVPLGNIALQALTLRKGARVYAYRGSLQKIDLMTLWNLAQNQQLGW